MFLFLGSLASRAFKEGEMLKYRKLLVATFILGVIFVALQIVGFAQMWRQKVLPIQPLR